MKKLFPPLMVGLVFGTLSVLLVQAPDRVGPVAIFLAPGFILGIVASNNVHEPSTWVATLGNFIFYFGVTYLASWLWERQTRRASGRRD